MNTNLRRPGRGDSFLDYATWLRVVQVVEKLNNLQVASPLQLSNPANGNMVLSLAEVAEVAIGASFWVTQSGALLIRVAEGWAYVSGVDTAVGGLTFDTDIDITGAITAHICYAYISVDMLASSASFAVAGAKPANTDTVEQYILAVLTTNAADTAIIGVKRCWFQDIHYWSKPA